MSQPQEAARPAGAPDLARLAGRYVTFRLADEDYGLEMLKVREIVGPVDITRVPRTQGFIRGVINLRGKVIPVVDLRLKLGMPTVQATEQTAIVVVQCRAGGRLLTTGLLVDQVLEALSVDAGDVGAAPGPGDPSVDTSLILGVGRSGGRVLLLLDLGRLLAADGTAGAETA